MRTAGIVAEYNPLHNGHVHHIEACREACKADYIIAVMSGDFVQRGEPAVTDKFTRAQWALSAGVDVVLELPTAYAVGSAERFSQGAVAVLAGTGVLNALCFGSEVESVPQLTEAAALLDDAPIQYQAALRQHLALGKSYPRARFDALQACGAPAEVLRVLQSPNAVLGMEYIRALRRFAPEAAAVPIPRIGEHDADNSSGFQSAAAIREALLSGVSALELDLPPCTAAAFAFSNTPPVTLQDAEQLILYALRRMDGVALRALPDVQEGFENVILRAARQCGTLDELLTVLKSKRYTMARCKRILIAALLGIEQPLLEAAKPEDAAYLRVLAFKTSARPLLAAIQKRRTLPMLLRAADIKALTAPARALVELDVRAHDIYNLISKKRAPRDFSAPPVTME